MTFFLNSIITPRLLLVVDFCPQIHIPGDESVYLSSLLYEVAIGTQIVPSLVRAIIYSSLHT